MSGQFLRVMAEQTASEARGQMEAEKGRATTRALAALPCQPHVLQEPEHRPGCYLGDRRA